MSNDEEISTTPVPGSAPPVTLPSTPLSLWSVLSSLPALAKPLAAWGCLGLAWAKTLPPLWDSIQLAYKSCASGWSGWAGPLIYATLTALCINPKTIKDAGGVVGAVGDVVDKIKGGKK